MNKKVKYTIIVVLLLAIIGALVWRSVNKEVNDLSGKQPDKTYSFNELMDKTSGDSATMKGLVGQFIAVNGKIKKITSDAVSTTVELGDTSSMSSITCQIDQRHQADCYDLKEGQDVCIKGEISAFSNDLDLGLGNTIQMKYCSINKTNK